MLMVFGCLHMTVTVEVPRLPHLGEVLGAVPGELLDGGAARRLQPGGRGAALALAVRRFGVPTQLVGAVGDDGFGEPVLDPLRLAGVDITRVRHLSGRATGVACVTAVAGSPPAVVVAPGANAGLRAHWVGDDELAACRSLLTHAEVPCGQSIPLAMRARHAGCRTLLQATPWCAATPPPRGVFDWVIYEPATLRQACADLRLATGVVDAADALARVADALDARTLLYRAEGGAIAADPAGACRRRSGLAQPVADPAAAFDVFSGVFAAALNQGMGESRAIDHALAAAALTSTSSPEGGPQAGQPTRCAIEDALLLHWRTDHRAMSH
jgi:ribokinase